jgi:hypothetical protein
LVVAIHCLHLTAHDVLNLQLGERHCFLHR